MDQEEKPASVDGPAEARPTLSPAKLAEKRRLAEALRANLRRRKAQVRGRRAETSEDSGPREA
ncbi:hypothetical protein [Rhodoblastus sp.]|uniref:hypothetical protein n=1 Tax=Rhodoblastus sp. TaxID=1962975 RepID=UPI0025D92DB2|nr:hypothetical protein [Rhodoblastus sp.]